jgi:hypothetical protein
MTEESKVDMVGLGLDCRRDDTDLHGTWFVNDLPEDNTRGITNFGENEGWQALISTFPRRVDHKLLQLSNHFPQLPRRSALMACPSVADGESEADAEGRTPVMTPYTVPIASGKTLGKLTG